MIFVKHKEGGCWSKYTVVFAMALLFWLLTGCGNNASSMDKLNVYHVRRAIDGDTIELSNGQKVRYIGINAPEVMKKEGEEWKFDPEFYGIEAKNFNSRLVRAKPIKLEFDEERHDQYGRQLAYVYADGIMINALLVREGYAMVYTFPPNIRYFREMTQYQREAVESGRGLWADLPKIKVTEASRYTGQMCQVSGRVSGKEVYQGKIYLDLVSEGEVYLKLYINLRNLKLFEGEGINAFSYYEGKNIELYGKINMGKRYPEMMVDNPFQINVLDEKI